MSFEWPERVQRHTRELVSQMLWTLWLDFDGKVADPYDAPKVLMDAMRARGVEIGNEMGFRILLPAMDNGSMGKYLNRKVEGKRTLSISLAIDELPENLLPEAKNEDQLDLQLFGDLRPNLQLVTATPGQAKPLPRKPEPAQRPSCDTEPPSPARRPARDHTDARRSARDDPHPSAAATDDTFLARMEAELAELRTPSPEPARPSVEDLVARSDDDPIALLSAIMGLTADLAAKMGDQASAADRDERLAEAIERAERMRRRALASEETAAARTRELEGLRAQLAAKQAELARLNDNLAAIMQGERVADGRVLRELQKLMAEKPTERHSHRDRQDSRIAYSVG